MTPVERNYALLTKLSRITFSLDDAKGAKALINHPEFDRGLFLASCFKQKVAGLAYLNITRWGIWKLLPWVGFPLKFFYLANRERNLRIRAELNRVIRRAAKYEVDMRPIKGSVLIPFIYSDGGSRLLIDIDFFVRRSELTAVSEVLATLGYTQGVFDKRKNFIVSLTREQKLLWQLKMFESPPFSKITDDEFLDYGNYFTIDLSFGLTFKEESDVSHLLTKSEAVIGGLRTLTETDFFIQLCAHLFKEASNESWASIDLDINLIKFCDVREFALRSTELKSFNALRDRVLELNAEEAVHFSLHNVFAIYRDAFVASMIDGLSFSFQDTAFMTSIYRQGGSVINSRERSLIESIGGLEKSNMGKPADGISK